jgi:hypothetical protein
LFHLVFPKSMLFITFASILLNWLNKGPPEEKATGGSQMIAKDTIVLYLVVRTLYTTISCIEVR